MNRLMAAAALMTALAWAAPAGAADRPARTTAKTKAEMRRELDALGARIDALETRARREGAEVRAKVDARVQALRAQQSDADRALGRFQAAGAETRTELQAAFDRAMAKLKSAVRRAETEAPWNRGSKAP